MQLSVMRHEKNKAQIVCSGLFLCLRVLCLSLHMP